MLVLTPVGGWGVLTADAVAGSDLELLSLSDDLRSAIDALLPPRWSRGNPIDTAAGETRDTIPQILELAVGHTDVHSVILLGGGIQSNQAALMRAGPFFESHELGRIAEYHERQDRRYAGVAAELSRESGKPILLASELAATDCTACVVLGPGHYSADGVECHPCPDGKTPNASRVGCQLCPDREAGQAGECSVCEHGHPSLDHSR